MRRSLRFLPLGVFLLAACSSTPPPPFQPVADVKQLMASVVDPAADTYWEAVGTIIDEKGVTEITPSTTEEWDQVRNAAYIFAEAGNLLMMSSRAKDGGEWMKQARALVDAGQKAVRAAESHNRTAVFDAGAEVYDVCTSCHVKYALEIQEKAAATAAAQPKKQP
jgi:hypothetical protein